MSDPTKIPSEKKASWSKKIVVFSVKLSIAGGLLYWLVASGRLDVSAIVAVEWTTRAIGLWAMGLLLMFAGLGLLAARLQLLMATGGIDVSRRRAYSITAIGAFFGAILPGLVGGDAVKAVYVCHSEGRHQKASVLAVVLVDRVIGLFSLFLLGTLALGVAALTGQLPAWSPILFVGPAVVAAVLITGGLLAYRPFVRNRLFLAVFHRFPKNLQRLISALRSFLKHPGRLALAVLLSLVNHALVCTTFVIAGSLLLYDDVSLAEQFVLNPLAMSLNAIPLTPGGIGLAESAFSSLYRLAGPQAGANVGLLGRMIQYCAFAIIGPLCMLLTRPDGKKAE